MVSMITKSVGKATVESLNEFRRVFEVLCRLPRVVLRSIALPANEVLHIA